METNLSQRFKERLSGVLGGAHRSGPPRLEKSLTQDEMTEAIREGSHPLGFDGRVAQQFLGSDVGGRSMVRREMGPLAYRVSAVNLNKMIGGVDGWKLERVFASGSRPFESHREAAPVYTEIETAQGKTERGLLEGSVVLRGPTGEVTILQVDFDPFCNVHMLSVLAKKDDGGREFLKSLDGLNERENFYKGQKITADGRFLKLAEISDDDLIFPPGLKEDLRRNVAARIERAAQYREFGLPTKRGLILAGAPGVGKSLFLKLLAKTLPVTFIQAVPTVLPRARSIASLFEFARSVSPSVIALEDAETICKYDWNGRDPRLVELLNQLDGVVENSGVTTILTTNYPAQLDKAIKDRPGRFDVRLDVPLPGKAEIVRIIRRNVDRLGKAKYVGSAAALDEIAQKMANAGVSGAYASEAVTYAAILAIENGRGENGALEITPVELGESAQRIVEYKKRMAEER